MGDKRQSGGAGTAGGAREFGWPWRHWGRTDSTNVRLREMAAAGAPHGTVVTAGEQTAGRGRQGRTWTAPAYGALLFSTLLRRPAGLHELLPLAVPLAVCEAAEELEPAVHCAVKWPNDVLVEGRKLAGVLIEARPRDGWAVIGVGLNLAIEPGEFPPELRNRAVSLHTAAGKPPPADRRARVAAAARALSGRLDRWFAAAPAEILAAWRDRDALRGREVAWSGGSGVADGVDDSGRLIVVTGGGRVVVGAGEVHLTGF